MLLRKKNPNLLLMIGFVFLIVANLSTRILPMFLPMSENARDGLAGFCYGVAVGAFVFSVWLRKRTQPSA